MKTKTFTFFLTLGVMLLNIISCQSNQPHSTEEQKIGMLKEFYTSYITANEKIPLDFAKIDSVKKEYCTANLLSKIKKKKLDYDPFLKAQDSNIKWLKSLSVEKDSKEKNLYHVTYTDSFSGKKIIIDLIVIKKNESYKIDDIVGF